MAGLYTEADYENSVIELFRNDLGYEYAYGPDIERDFYSPLYEEVLLDSLYRLNRGLPDDAIQDAMFKLKNFENGELVQKNAVFMDYLQNGIPVRYFVDGEERSSIVYLVDYKNPDNNSFIVANQWTFIENSNKRPDVILFLNGLPVVLVELKSPSREETDASEAYRQLRNYMKEIPSMFIYNAICVMSDQLTSKAGTITSGEDRFMEWKTKDGDYENTQYAQFDTFFEGMFQKARLLDIIKTSFAFLTRVSIHSKFLPDTTSILRLERQSNLRNTLQLPTVKAVYFGTPKAAESRCLWCSMPICCKKRWTARRLLLSQTETTLTTSFTVSLQSAKTF